MPPKKPNKPKRHQKRPPSSARRTAARVRKPAELLLQANESFTRDVLNSLSAHICVLNRDGVIIRTNDAWNRFARENGGQTATFGVGDNYLEVCRRAIADGDTTVSPILSGIEAVLAGQQSLFNAEYPCHSPDEARWFLLRVSPLMEAQGVVLSRLDISERKRVEELLLVKQHELERSQAQLQDLTAKLITAQEEERQRIARELHDDTMQRLAALVIDLRSLRLHGSIVDESVLGSLDQLSQRAKQLRKDVQHMAYQLHPSILEHLGLEAAVREHVEEFAARTGLATQVVSHRLPQRIPLAHATCLFRVLQESLQNVSKHANATNALIRLLTTRHGVGLCVHDNGRGFEQALEFTKPKGLGLVSMTERVGILKGTFRIKTKPGDGTEVHAWVPLKPHQAAEEEGTAL